jgi:uncharacterized protein YjbJ (UPF0337 family)
MRSLRNSGSGLCLPCPLRPGRAPRRLPASRDLLPTPRAARRRTKGHVEHTQGEAKGHVDHMKGHAKDAKGKAHKATGDAAEKANSAATRPARRKGKVDAAAPGMDASGEAEAGGAAK